jgi:sugar/nucleoside kinase (ribokinase family)
VVKQGAGGAIGYTGTETVVVPAPLVDVVEPTRAGDAVWESARITPAELEPWAAR